MSISLDINIDTSEIESRFPEFLRILGSLPEWYIKDATEIVGDQMRLEIPKGGSGRLEASVTESIDGLTGTVQTNTGYGAAVDQGRRGFTVRPRNGQFLRFFAGGKIVYARESHPGPAKGNFFVKRTIMGAGSRITPQIDDRTMSELSKT